MYVTNLTLEMNDQYRFVYELFPDMIIYFIKLTNVKCCTGVNILSQKPPSENEGTLVHQKINRSSGFKTSLKWKRERTDLWHLWDRKRS